MSDTAGALMAPCYLSASNYSPLRWNLTFLLSRAYFWDMGSYQMMSPVEKPMIMSRCVALLVTVLMS